MPVTEEPKGTADSPLLSSSTEASDGQEEASEEQRVQETTNEVSPEEPSLEVEEKELFHQMMEAGVFYGRSKSKTNPLTREYILTTRSGFEVINLQGAIKHLKDAAEVLKKVMADKGLVLFVGTSPAAKSVIRGVAERLESPFVTERWLGGTLTNFKTIKSRIDYFKKLKDDKETGELKKYTKKEQLKMSKELAKLDKLFGGIESLDKMPSLLFIADLVKNEYAAREAKQKGIPIIAFLNTDADPKLVDHPIPANDKSRESIKLLMKYLEEAANEGKMQAATKKEEAPSTGVRGETSSKSQSNSGQNRTTDSGQGIKAEATKPTRQTGSGDAPEAAGEASGEEVQEVQARSDAKKDTEQRGKEK